MPNRAYHEIVESIYDAALNPERWKDVVTLIKDEFDSIAAGFFVQTAAHELQEHFLVGIEGEQIEAYRTCFADKNPWFTVPGLMRPGHILTDLSLERLHNDKRAFLDTELCQDWYRPQGFRHSMGGTLVDKGGQLLNFTFLRSQQQGYYTESEIRHYRPLCRHLMKAVELNDKVRDTFAWRSLSAHALDALRIGVVLLDAHRRVVFLNEYAKRLTSARHGLSLHVARLSASDSRSAGLVAAALDRAYRQGRSETINVSRTSKSALSVTIVPQRHRAGMLGFSEMCASVFITDPDDRNIGSAEYMAARWNLTPLEATFALHLVRGLSIVEIAKHMELTPNTARWYAKQVRAKLGARRQSELVALLLNDAGGFLRQQCDRE